MQKDDASPPTAVDAGSNGDADLVDGGASTRHAYEELRRQILFGELEPGATFSQVKLSTQLGVSRTPLREAVRLLQTEGLLRSEPRQRVRVSPITTDDFPSASVSADSFRTSTATTTGFTRSQREHHHVRVWHGSHAVHHRVRALDRDPQPRARHALTARNHGEAARAAQPPVARRRATGEPEW